MKLTADTTFYVDNVNGNDSTADGLTRAKAFRTPQACWWFIANEVELNNWPVTIFLIRNMNTNGTPVPYSNLIATWAFNGLPHDYGITVRGELNSSGTVDVLMETSADGCIIVGQTQVYVRDLAFKSTGEAPCVLAAYQGFLALDNVIFYGSENRSMIECGPKFGAIDINSPWWIINSGNAGMGCFTATDYSTISVPAEATCTIVGNPHFGNDTTAGFLNLAKRSTIELRNVWSGSARGKRWVSQADSMILTGYSNPDTYLPGTIAGASLDGTGYKL